ncbi:MAG: thioredoxin domain-containing protein [Proteobacteria bacterium]|nr:thioredoxin domain-containing protein [Pseudomonadota bacterium]
MVSQPSAASGARRHLGPRHSRADGRPERAAVDRGLVKYVYRDFPLDRFALQASMIARCAGPDRFFAFIDVMFTQQESWAQSNDPTAITEGLRRIAKLGGMSDTTFDNCLKDSALQTAVLNQSLKGEKEFEVRGTPTLIINGRKYTGGLTFAEIDKALKPLAGPS